jgi:hypothetical protein
MGSKRPETMAKRARELAVKEKRERKRARKAEAAAAKEEATQIDPDAPVEDVAADDAVE